MTDAKLRALLDTLVPAEEAGDLAGLVAQLPDPAGAARLLERLLESGAAPPDPARLRSFLIVAGFSPFLGRLLVQNPAFLDGLADARTGLRLRTREDLDEDLARFQSLNAAADVSAVLRRFRNREYTRVALADFLGAADVPAVTRALSLLADTLLDKAVRSARGVLEERHGGPTCRDSRGVLEDAGFVVLALGKLGGEELNYSSDIDLVYLYSRDGETSGGLSGAQPIPNKVFFARLAADVTALIAGRGPEGQVFRVDLGLRPGGKDGDIVVSLGSAMAYYQGWAEPWERQALLKARPAAGDLELGKRFLEGVRPLVFPEQPDPYLALEIAAMKDRIDTQLSNAGRSESDIKLGRGGIRELEFGVQALQLLHGGRDPWLQHGNTLLALHRLADKGFLGYPEYAGLAEAYVFLRTVEHRLQLGQDHQTAILPSRPEQWDLLARRMPLGTEAAGRETAVFSERLERHREMVRRFYDSVLGRAAQGTLEEAEGPDFWLDRVDDDALRGRLEAAGLPDAAATVRPVRMIRRLLRPVATPGIRRALRRNGRELLQVAGRTVSARRALANLERLLSALVVDPGALERFLERREVLGPAVRLLGQSDLLGGLLIRQPELLDDLADRGRMLKTPDLPTYHERLEKAVAGEPDVRSRPGALRRAQQRELGTTAVRDINRQATLRESLKALSDLADASLRVVLDLARPPTGSTAMGAAPRLAVLALGRLGYRELDYGSDLDLVFVHDAPSMEEARVVRTWCEQAVRLLSTLSRDGQLYKVDLRLRPSGREGDLVTSRAALEAYFRRDAEVWELQSFMKARAVAGDLELGAAVVAALETIALERSRAVGPAVLAAAVDQMRRSLQASPGAGGLKLGSGGIVEVHFIIEYLQLAHGVPGMPDKDTLRLLTHLNAVGLLGDDRMRALYEAYLHLRTLDHCIRLLYDRPLPTLPSDPARLREIAQALRPEDTGESAPVRLLETLAARRRAVREVYERVVLAPSRDGAA